MIEEILIELGKAVLPLIKDAIAKGASNDDVMRTIEASMIAASDAEMLRELGADAPVTVRP